MLVIRINGETQDKFTFAYNIRVQILAEDEAQKLARIYGEAEVVNLITGKVKKVVDDGCRYCRKCFDAFITSQNSCFRERIFCKKCIK